MNPFKSTRKGLSARRLLLLASVAATAITVVAFGPSSYVSSGFASFITPARAATASQSPTGFADIVAKVKPAVISVRVKVDETEKLASMSDNDESGPLHHLKNSSNNSVSVACRKECRRASKW
jgi:serine protease Do